MTDKREFLNLADPTCLSLTGPSCPDGTSKTSVLYRQYIACSGFYAYIQKHESSRPYEKELVNAMSVRCPAGRRVSGPGGCQTVETSHATRVTVDSIKETFSETGCLPGSCAKVEINALRFPGSPALTEQLRLALLSMGMGISEDQHARPTGSWEAFAQDFIAQAEAGHESVIQSSASQALLEADVYARHNDLLVVELDSYIYHAGQAHGMPLTQFMVIDERLERVVGFDDMVIDGQEAAFEKALARAHQRWLQQTGADDDFVVSWPLSESRNVAPREAGWAVRYNVYDIAPYAAGQPELRIPDEELEGIVKPRYLNGQ